MDSRRKSILRERSGRFSTGSPGFSAAFPAGSSARRRVSFNPEVTLHKIDLVLLSSPANGAKRRRTMDAAEVSQLQKKDAFLGSNWQTEQNYELDHVLPQNAEAALEHDVEVTDMDPAQLGSEVLQDSSDEEDNDGVSPGATHEMEGQEPTMELTEIHYVPPVNSQSHSHSQAHLDNVAEIENDREETMELTGQVKFPIPLHQTDNQETAPAPAPTPAVTSLSVTDTDDYELFGNIASDSEPEMELTKSISVPTRNERHLPNEPPELHSQEPVVEQDNSDMLLTQAVRINISNLVSEAGPEEQELEMELTQSLGISLYKPDPQQVVSQENDQDEQEMELTQHRLITVNSRLATVVEDVSVPETAAQHEGSISIEIANNASQENGGEDMEITQVVAQTRLPSTTLTQGSQEVDASMEMTQVGSTITFASASDKDEPAGLEKTEQEHKIIRSARPLVITTKVPLADPDGEDADSSNIIESNNEESESQDSGLEVVQEGNNSESQGSEYDEEMDSYLPVELSDFLADIGVAFLEDEDVDFAPMDTLSNELGSLEFTPTDYAKAYAKLQLYNLYKFACEEITNTSKESLELFKEFNNVIKENNPDIFRKFYRADESERANYRLKFHMVKQFARYQSEKIWYEWRIQTTETVIQRLEEKYVGLQEDKQRLINDLAMIDDIYAHVKREYLRMEDDFKAFEQREQEISLYSEEELGKIRDKYEGLSTQLSQVSQELESKQESAILLEHSLQAVEELKAKYQQELNRNMALLNERRKFQQQDVEKLMDEFRVLIQVLDIDIVSFEHKELQFVLDKWIVISMNLDDVLNLDNISFELKRKDRFHFGALQQYVQQIWMLMPSANVLQVYRNFAKVYYNLKQLDEDLYLIGLKFRVQFDNQRNTENSEEGVVGVQLSWYDFQGRSNGVIHLMIALKDLVEYPPAFKIRVERVSNGSGRWKHGLLAEMVNNRLFNPDTLDEVNND